MQVRYVMTRGAERVAPGETVQAAARRMKETGVGALVVCDDDERAVGMLTDRDIVVRSTAEAADPARALVRGAMTPQLVTCDAEADLADAARVMAERGVRRLVVMDEDERIVGLLSVDDVALYSRDLAGEVIEHARAPDRPVQRVWPWWE